MCEYALITLNMIECQNSSNTPEKHSVEYAIITENVSDAVQSIKSPYSFQNRCIQKTVKTFKMDCFAKKQCLSGGAQSDIFQGRRMWN